MPDPHSYGSGNPGATNVLRTGNKAAAALTLFADGAKGWLAVFLARQFGQEAGVEPWTLAAVALAVFLGHLFPVFHRFRGGKGVATAAGIMLGLDLRLAAATLAVWFVVAVAFRISSLAALVAAIIAPVFAFYFFGNDPRAWVLVPHRPFARVAAPRATYKSCCTARKRASGGQEILPADKEGVSEDCNAANEYARTRSQRGRTESRPRRRRQSAARRRTRSSRRCRCRARAAG